MYKPYFGWIAILMLATFVFTGCGEDDDQPTPPVIGTITDFILTNVQGTNGVIHLIDAVLLPDNF